MKLSSAGIIKPRAGCSCLTLQKVSKCDGGFNFCVRFRRAFQMDQISLIEKLIDRTGVAILTESSFSLNPVYDNRFLIRFSAACDQAEYDKTYFSRYLPCCAGCVFGLH